MRRQITIMAVLVAAAAAGGCRSFNIETPDAFLELEDQRRASYDYRATTADGVVLAVQSLPNKQNGTLEFWSEAIRNKLRDVRGYALLEETDVRTSRGLAGKQMRFGRDESGQTYRYWVTVFVRPEGASPKLWVIEAGGLQEAFERRQRLVEQTIATFAPR